MSCSAKKQQTAIAANTERRADAVPRRGAPEAVDAYWATIPVADRWERESVAPPAKKASAKRDAAAAKLDDTPAKSHKKKEPASASATKDKAPPAKKAKEDKKDKAEKPAKKDKAPKADKVKPDKVQQPKKAADKVVVPATDDEAAQSDDESAGEYTAGEQSQSCVVSLRCHP